MALVVGAAYLAGFTDLISVPVVLAKRETIKDWVSANQGLAAIGFVAVYIVVTGMALPGAAILSLLGGFLFGRWLGIGLVLVGATSAALIVFLVARSTLGEPLRGRAGPLYDTLAAGMKSNAVEVLLFLRLVPLVPFFLVNLVAAVFDIRLRTFLLTTAIGVMPVTFIYTTVGREIGTVTSPAGLLSPAAMASLAGLAGLSLLPILMKRRRPPVRVGKPGAAQRGALPEPPLRQGGVSPSD